MSTKLRALAVTALSVFLMFFTVQAANAATITVTGVSNAVAPDGHCSLSEAITAANTDAAVEECPAGSGADNIVFDSNLFATPQTIYFAPSNFNIVISSNLTISGTGPANLTLAGDGSLQQFVIFSGFNVTFENLTLTGFKGVGGGAINNAGVLNVVNCAITGNFALGDGGGIYSSSGTLVVSNSVITGNQAVSDGGGIGSNGGSVTIVNSTVSNNFVEALNASSGNGGGLYSFSSTLSITDSVISGNRSADGFGGGIYSSSGNVTVSGSTISNNQARRAGGGGLFGSGLVNSLTISDSTISGNIASSSTIATLSGGGIRSNMIMTVTNSTVSGNTAGLGGGISSTNFTIKNSTVSGNTGGGILGSGTIGNTILNQGTSGANLVAFGTNATFTSLGYNISSDNGGGFLTGNGDQISTDPLLGPLQNNGGLTHTHALLPNSPAIDAGDPNFTSPPANDQRGTGFPRVLDGRIDIGAFESGTDTTPPVITPTVTGTLGNNGWYTSAVTVTWSVTDPESTVSDQTGCGAVTVSSETTGETITCSATSAGGQNSASVTIKIDMTAPFVSPPTVSPNPVLLNGSATVTHGGATDAVSGIASESCDAVDTSTVGTKTVMCYATDNAGNTGSASASYTVIFDFAGFFQPVDNLPAVNVVSAGSAIPVKFGLAGYQGLNIFAAGYPASYAVACDSDAPVSTIEETVNAGGSSLSYDATTGLYNYVWKTNKAWRGTCRMLVVRLTDGTDHIAKFRFR